MVFLIEIVERPAGEAASDREKTDRLVRQGFSRRQFGQIVKDGQQIVAVGLSGVRLEIRLALVAGAL